MIAIEGIRGPLDGKDGYLAEGGQALFERFDD